MVFAIMQFLARFHLVWDQKNRSTLIFENQKKKIISFRRCLACRNQDFCCHLPLLCTVHKQISNRPKECLLSSHLAISWFGLRQCSNAPMRPRCKSRARVCKSTEARYFIWASGHAPRATGGCGSSSWLHMLHKVLFVGVYIWICVLDYLNKTQDSRSFGAKPPCQDLIKIS